MRETMQRLSCGVRDLSLIIPLIACAQMSACEVMRAHANEEVQGVNIRLS